MARPLKNSMPPFRESDDVTKLIKLANGRITEHLPDLIDKLIELGRGVQAKGKQRGNGAEYVYDVPPNFKALEYLCNRVLGKPVDESYLGDPNSVAEITVRYENDWRSIPDATPMDDKKRS